VTPKKWRSFNLGLIGRQKRFFPRVKPARKRPQSSARRGALPMSNVAACVKHHITRIGVVRHDGQNRPQPRTFDDRLRHERTVPLRFVCGHRRSDRQLQHGGVLTFAQLRQ
jgi:hypothetical protein